MKTAARTILATAVVLALAAAAPSVARAQAPAPAAAASPSIQGTWALNQDLSDKAPARGGGDTGAQGRRGGGGGGGRGGGFGRRGGGFGGGGGGFGNGGGATASNPDATARMQDAMRDIMTPPSRLTIVQTDSMIIITTDQGRTTRLSPDGKGVKDDNTGIERKTKWDAGKLVSEISGLGQGKITQSYVIDPDQHQLHVTVTVPARGGGSNQPRVINQVYDSGDTQ